MARDRANIKTAIHTDDDWRALTIIEQHLYWLLMTHPKLSYVGVADWRPARLAAMTRDMTPQSIRAAAEGLQAARFVLIDDETEEILIRSFLRHDGLLKQPKLSISMVNSYADVASKRIREVITFELQRLNAEFPDWAAFRQDRVMSLVKGKGTDISAFTQGLTLPLTPEVTPLFRVNDDQAQGLPTSTATTTATSPSGEGVQGERKKQERPLPATWQPNDAHKSYAASRSLDFSGEAERFKLHAQANDRRQRDWDASFRMWLSKAKPVAATNSVPQQYGWANQ
ncbi:hypothetical protein [Paenarthrobacter nitroguajacolicus]|uniref:hypothetical protein n=1 Tax=Paenarthrobacter nitroguajacolicus TaxID=211146 RepID=UPI00248D37C1|nr:hypothetical protein [Paenarthrobacter nitroguajacolicus]MDI2032979.1 hypothetical protein [Paenarthrobacter nitroguajacolicus]